MLSGVSFLNFNSQHSFWENHDGVWCGVLNLDPLRHLPLQHFISYGWKKKII